MPSKVPEGGTRGWIVPIGGAENKENDRRVLARFVEVSGGAAADIVVIPTASRLHETGPRYETLFRELGAARVSVMDFDTRRDCQEPNRLQQARGSERHLLHRRQPAPANNASRRHARRNGDPQAQRRRRHGRRHECRCQHSERAHDRVRRRGVVGDLRKRAAGAGPRADEPVRDRSAFPAAGPAGAPDHRAGVQPVRGRHRAR